MHVTANGYFGIKWKLKPLKSNEIKDINNHPYIYKYILGVLILLFHSKQFQPMYFSSGYSGGSYFVVPFRTISTNVLFIWIFWGFLFCCSIPDNFNQCTFHLDILGVLILLFHSGQFQPMYFSSGYSGGSYFVVPFRTISTNVLFIWIFWGFLFCCSIPNNFNQCTFHLDILGVLILLFHSGQFQPMYFSSGYSGGSFFVVPFRTISINVLFIWIFWGFLFCCSIPDNFNQCTFHLDILGVLILLFHSGQFQPMYFSSGYSLSM